MELLIAWIILAPSVKVSYHRLNTILFSQVYRSSHLFISLFSCIPPSHSVLRNICSSRSTKEQRESFLSNLIHSSAANAIPCYLLGLTDRHTNNVLYFHTPSPDKLLTGTCFQIDFGYILGETPSTPKASGAFLGIKNNVWKVCLCLFFIRFFIFFPLFLFP